MPDRSVLVRLSGVERNFGAVHALRGIDLEIRAGRMLGVVGHNGAGKSTLTQILAGTLSPSSGEICVAGHTFSAGYGVRAAQALGIRCVFQELSLCPNLRVFENALVMHRRIKGFGWRRHARQLIRHSLDTIFPGHRIDPDRRVASLPIGERQMVEIARAFIPSDNPLRLIILDEATASLDATATQQLLEFIGKAYVRNVACIFISHRLREIVDHADDVVVLRDGKVVGTEPAATINESKLISMMGEVHETESGETAPTGTGGRILAASSPESTILHDFRVSAGEIIGLAGLAGHGQREVLRRIFTAGRGVGSIELSVSGTVAYVSGDRGVEGVFPLWSVQRNISIGSLRQLTRWGLIDRAVERQTAEQWCEDLKIRTPDVGHEIIKLSGGNQQKVLVARAFGSGADILLFDDPMRGVDVNTKRELYGKMRRHAAAGHAVVWYTTENAELHECDRIYVFSQGQITDHMRRSEYSEERVIRSSFVLTPEHAG